VPIFRSNFSIMSDNQIQILALLERVGGSISLICLSLIFLASAVARRLRTEPNTLILFTSISSALASIACIMGDDGIQQGMKDPLCQTQGFLLDMYVEIYSGSKWRAKLTLSCLLDSHCRPLFGL
jgi:hypothetical protein